MTSKTNAYGWQLTSHCCRICYGRVLTRVNEDDEGVYRCADCGAERTGHSEKLICCCGSRIRGKVDLGIRCQANADPRPGCASEIIAVQSELPKHR